MAPILFLSSNPSINELEMPPDSSLELQQIIDFSQNRLSSSSRWVDRLCALRKDGTRTEDLRAINPLKEPSIKIPAQAVHLLVQILDEMSRGNAVKRTGSMGNSRPRRPPFC